MAPFQTAHADRAAELFSGASLLTGRSLPHPFPYQGSKRAVAAQILPRFPRSTRRLIEPFCGSAAVSIAAAANDLAARFWLSDSNGPLMALWEEILRRPAELADRYEELWRRQHPDRKEFFVRIRAEFNRAHAPHHLLYLLARIVKGSVRYAAGGRFNQSPDNRRAGMRPEAMRRQLQGVSALLADRTALTARDFREVLRQARPSDLVYMDPPYQGTSFTRDHRYHDGLGREEFARALELLNRRCVPYLVSYDGRTGDREHGAPLPRRLGLRRLEVPAGRSSQATLLGRRSETVESLYLSPALVERLQDEARAGESRRVGQAELLPA